jgi:hypothetical protein
MRRKNTSSDDFSELEFKSTVVSRVAEGKTEQALELLAEHYGVDLPRIRVGLPRSHGKNVLGCYTAGNKTIYVFNSDAMKQPFVILHEFYHHLRTSVDKKHRGTENYANEFAKGFIEAYKVINVRRVSGW